MQLPAHFEPFAAPFRLTDDPYIMHVFLLLCYLMVSVIRLSAGFLLEDYGLRRPEQHVSAIFVTSNGRHSLEVVALHLVSSPPFSSPVWAWETG